jgi:hypothetical protein
MYDTAFYKPHAMLAFYKVNRAPKERTKRESSNEFEKQIDLVCTAIESEEEAHKKAKEVGFNIEDFADVHSLTLAIGFFRECKEKVDYYRRKKSLDFAKVFEELSKMTAKKATEELNALGITYQDNRKSIKELQGIEEISKYFKDMF